MRNDQPEPGDPLNPAPNAFGGTATWRHISPRARTRATAATLQGIVDKTIAELRSVVVGK